MRLTSLVSPGAANSGMPCMKNTTQRGVPFIVDGSLLNAFRCYVKHSREENVFQASVAASALCSKTYVKGYFGLLSQRTRGLMGGTWGSRLSGYLANEAEKKQINNYLRNLHTSTIRAVRRNSSETAPGSTSQMNNMSCTTGSESAAVPHSIVNDKGETRRLQPGKLTADEYEKRLRQRVQAAGPRPAVLHRLQDPLTVHLYRVAASRPYRNSRESVLVTGSTLVKELRTHFRCKRLLVGRRTKMSEIGTDSAIPSAWPAFPPVNVSVPKAEPRVQTEIYRASDRLLKKLAGLHSYGDGIVAEMQLPAETKDFGDIKLLLCLGDPPPSQELDRRSKLVDFPKSINYTSANSVGMYGTLLRSAAALHWQGVWILPKCPDVFTPLGTRASQGALFWMPYRTGGWEALLQFAAERQLLLCVPHHSGVDAQSPGLLGENAKGLCLVVDGEAHLAAQKMVDTQCQAEVSCSEGICAGGGKADVTAPRRSMGTRAHSPEIGFSSSSDVVDIRGGLPRYFCPDRLLSVAPPSLPASTEATRASRENTSNSCNSSIGGSAGGSTSSCNTTSSCFTDDHSSVSTVCSVMQDEIMCMHPLTMYTLLMYQLKRVQFPSTYASSYIFSVKKKQKNVAN